MGESNISVYTKRKQKIMEYDTNTLITRIIFQREPSRNSFPAFPGKKTLLKMLNNTEFK